MHIGRQGLHDRHAIGQAVGRDNLARDLGHSGGFDGIDAGGPGAAGEQAENAGPAPHVSHDRVRPDALGQGPPVKVNPDWIREVKAMFVDD
jgi:hypothetical protein